MTETESLRNCMPVFLSLIIACLHVNLDAVAEGLRQAGPVQPTRVFPGAVVFGVETPAGTDGRVIRVTNLDSHGPDSLQAAIEAEGPRLVVFDVGGVIDLDEEHLRINHPFLTIAGQTAPSPGITIIKGSVYAYTNDILQQPVRLDWSALVPSEFMCFLLKANPGHQVCYTLGRKTGSKRGDGT